MTDDELKKEAIKFVVGYPTSYGKGYKHKDLRIAYLAGAEPREKRIEELEKHNEEVIALIYAERERQEKCNDVHLQRIADLEKENAELKEQNIKDCENFNKAMKETKEQWNKDHYQLTEAKEIIEKLISQNRKLWVYSDVREQAEQLLKEMGE